MRKLSLCFILMLICVSYATAQPITPSAHGLDSHQPAWNQNQIQEFNLNPGFSWWSTYIDLNDNGLSILQNALGSDASLIKAQNAFTSYNPDTGDWIGDSFTIDNSAMYLLKINDCSSSFFLEGNIVHPEDINIQVNQGWNWVGYPNTTTVSVHDALADYNASNNDMIKGQFDFSTYSAQQEEWFGTLNTLTPGNGYIILSRANETKTFHYSNGSKTADLSVDTPNTLWRTNPKMYAQNMTVIATVRLQGIDVKSDDYEIGAFHNDECRGTTRLKYVEGLENYLAFLTVYGTEGESIQFRLLDYSNDAIYLADIQQNITYHDNGILGLLDTPYQLEFRDMLSAEETLASMLTVYPNPMNSTQSLTISLPESQTLNKNLKIQVFNLLGQVISEKTLVGHTCTIGGLTSGIYMLRVLSDNAAIYNNKLIVK